nr:PREDICTED: chromatin assembly factor 1 subunit A-B [Linepithema humile]
MKIMDISIEDDCVIETVTPVKKKKMKQAQLPFHTSSSSKSPNTNNVPNKKKRKIATSLGEYKSPKILKLATKENSVKNVSEDEKEDEETKLDSSSDSNEMILDEKKKDLEKDNQQNHKKNKKIDTTSSRKVSLDKSRKLDKSQQKTGALKKFFKKAEKEAKGNTNRDNSLCKSKSKQKQQDTSVQNERNEICLNKNPNKQSSKSQANEKLDPADIADKDANYSHCQELDSDTAILSSDNETASELDKTISSRNEETTSKSTPTTPTTPTTPKSSKTSKNMKEKIKKLTPKQLEKRQEIAKRKEEKLRLKEEKEKQREEEKANRQREREKKQREKEEKERIEKEQKKREKELKEHKKQMEIEQKQKEKEAKEEDRRKREEEKRKKEEEKLEAERKKQKAASNFASFFVSKKQEVKSAEEESVVQAKNFMPFEIKADMRIAPVCRRTLSEHEKLILDEICNIDSKKSELYLQDIKTGKILPHTSSKTWPLEAKDNDIILLDEDNDDSSNIITDTHKLEKHRPKLLQFCENRRPPYWGTWRKQSNILKSRRPFVKDKKWFDYEIDSDDEWEEEEPGESLKGSDDEKDEENPEENEYDVDNEFMVPHGYLSDEEAQAGEEEMEDMSPQTQKMKLKILGEQFEAERNAKTYKLKPKIIGCIWQERKNLFPESISTKVKEFLSARQAWVNNIPIILPSSTFTEDDTSLSAECKAQTPQSVRGPRKTKFPNEALPDLIRLLHGNTYGRHFLTKEFMTFWSKKSEKQLSKVSVLEKINEIANKVACPEEGPMHLKSCWYVSEDNRKQYLPDDALSLPNRWKYTLTPNRKSDTQDITVDKIEKEEKEKEKEKKHVPLITQFTKKITQEEMKKQLTKSDQEETKKQLSLKVDQVSTSSKPPVQRPPKRATLISVGRGEQFPEKSRESILAKFVSLNKKKEEPSSSEKMNIDSDDIIFIESIDKDKTE